MENEYKTETGLALCHPTVSFVYFVAVIMGALLFVHPVFGGISLFCAVLYSVQINDRKSLGMYLKIGIPVMVFIAVANPLFVHRGMTVLFFVFGSPVTFESLMYGVVSAVMMFSAVMWFTCYNRVITSDKFLFIFGRFLPSIALVISMTLSLIPRLLSQIKTISEAQRSIGVDWKSGTLKERVGAGSKILSILVSWALEDAVVTADSMSARGYGLARRTSFSIYRFGKRDGVMLFVILALFAAEIAAFALGRGTMEFYPFITWNVTDIFDIIFYASYLTLGLLPSILQIREDRKWKRLK